MLRRHWLLLAILAMFAGYSKDPRSALGVMKRHGEISLKPAP